MIKLTVPLTGEYTFSVTQKDHKMISKGKDIKLSFCKIMFLKLVHKEDDWGEDWSNELEYICGKTSTLI